MPRKRTLFIATSAAALGFLGLLITGCTETVDHSPKSVATAGPTSSAAATPITPATFANTGDNADSVDSGCWRTGNAVTPPIEVQDEQGQTVTTVTLMASPGCNTAWARLSPVTKDGLKLTIQMFAQDGRQGKPMKLTADKADGKLQGYMLKYGAKKCVYAQAGVDTTPLKTDTNVYCGPAGS